MNKQSLTQILAGLSEEILALGEELFLCPELGFKEVQTAKRIGEYLKEADIPFTSALSCTGVKATLGKEGYHIALVADIDAVAVSDNGTMKPFHSCGHNIQVAVLLGILKAFKLAGITDEFGGRISFIGTPAEEYIDLDYRRELQKEGRIRHLSGKQDMISKGVFDDVDAILSCHVMGDQSKLFDFDSRLTGFAVKKVTFTGKGSHSGAAAHEGRNALNAASLFLTALAFLNEQFPAEAGLQVHPIISQGGISMNVIPENAVVETYLRANTIEWLDSIREKFDLAAEHSAKALGIDFSIEDTPGYLPLVQSPQLNRVVLENLNTVCSPESILTGTLSGASGDIGDLAALIPSIQLGFSGIEGRIHSNVFSVVNPQNAYIDTAKVLLGTAFDLFSQPELRPIQTDFSAKKEAYQKNWLLEK